MHSLSCRVEPNRPEILLLKSQFTLTHFNDTVGVFIKVMVKGPSENECRDRNNETYDRVIYRILDYFIFTYLLPVKGQCILGLSQNVEYSMFIEGTRSV